MLLLRLLRLPVRFPAFQPPCPRRKGSSLPPVALFALLLLLSLLPLLIPCDVLSAECGAGAAATISGNYERPEGWRSDCLCSGEAPKIVVLSGTLQVKRGNFVEMRLREGNGACPPYTWQVEGKDFHFESATGPGMVVTEDRDAVLALWAGPSSCGPAYVTVTDGCGLGVTMSFRDPDHGQWVLVYDTPCGVTTPRPGG
ncbi:MAG: hypothetical protein JRH05_07475 [Deltaproteobacteria bacterium]|nr:hypothetical protein [Deltaproteobacteria bacterium]